MTFARRALLALAMIAALGASAAPVSAAAAALQLWRLDGGTAELGDLDLFSDSFAYVGQTKTIPISVYLIRHGDQYLMWDAGLPADNLGKRVKSGVNTHLVPSRLADQLARIGVRPDQITYLAISHNHDDHIGQAADFPKATLLIGKADYEATAAGRSAARLAPWLTGGGKVEFVPRDRDVFGDGSVVMLGLPGHTDGHHGLLVRLATTGPVLLTGDVFHFEENRRNRVVPGFNANRADSLASMDRFEAIARNLKAKVVIGHELNDVAKLPTFPAAAD